MPSLGFTWVSCLKKSGTTSEPYLLCVSLFQDLSSFPKLDGPCQDDDQLVIASLLPWVECGDQSTRGVAKDPRPCCA